MREDWIECKFGDVLNIKNGKNQKLVENPEGIYPIYGSSGIIGWADEYLCDEETTIIGRKGTINTPIFVNTKFWNVDTAFGLTPFNILNSRLLFFFCKLFNFHALDKSTTIPSLAKSDLLQIDFSLPPFPEQRAIVKKLESLFSSLDAGVADLKKAQQQLKIYRQAVLRKSLDAKKKKSISELIQNLSQGWSPKCLSENVENDEEWAVIKTTAVQHGEFLPYENKKLPTDLEPREQHQIEVGDILITRAGPRIRVGVCCLVRKTKIKLINCDKVYRIKLKDTVVLPEYFELVLNSPDYLKLINDIKTGSSDSGLNLTQDRFLKLEIPLPSVKEQIEIIKQIESRLSVCDSIEQNIKESLAKAEALRQSILKKAFEGNLLTAQELAECKQAADYEPASVLLERIKMEQTELKAKPTKKKQSHSVAEY